MAAGSVIRCSTGLPVRSTRVMIELLPNPDHIRAAKAFASAPRAGSRWAAVVFAGSPGRSARVTRHQSASSGMTSLASWVRARSVSAVPAKVSVSSASIARRRRDSSASRRAWSARVRLIRNRSSEEQAAARSVNVSSWGGAPGAGDRAYGAQCPEYPSVPVGQGHPGVRADLQGAPLLVGDM